MFGWFKRRRRERIRQQPFPAAWRRHLDENVPALQWLEPEERRRLEGLVQVFLAEKRFEGCGGLEMTDEIRVTIAGQATLLVLNRDETWWPGLSSVLVYPRAFVVRHGHAGPDGTVSEEGSVLLGESWHRGSVILSWDDVRHGVADTRDGLNVVLHEFAHQLDGHDGDYDGAPVLDDRAALRTWAAVLGESYERLQEQLERHRKPFIDAYGATNPPEFFAVVTETFFEKPRTLKRKEPELYEVLADFYRQDPAARKEARLRGSR